MEARRAFCAVVIGTAAAAAARRSGLAQSAAGQAQGQGWSDGGLPNRGAPTGRIGAATRSARSAGEGITLDLVAPLRGVGLTSADQPVLYYLLSGRAAQPLRFAMSAPKQARPLADLELPRAQPASGLGAIRLRDHGIRLSPGQTCTWSVTLVLDPRAPSRDLVASALIEHRPHDPALDAAARDPLPERQIAMLVRAGYWYDAVALAEQNQNRDRGTALAWVFQQAELQTAAAAVSAVVR
jgi:Domain of Unknown Function (DUF928)